MKDLVINQKHLQNDEHFQFNGEFGDTVDEFGADNLKIEPQYQQWNDAFQQEDMALKKIKKSARTGEIHLADKRRNDLFRGLADSCRTATNHYNAAIKRAATELQVVFDSYGNLARVGLGKKTSAIFNLLQELRENHAKEICIAGLEGWIEELETSNIECQQLMKERFSEVGARTKIVMREARMKVDAAYDDIIGRIKARRLIEEDNEIYGKFLDRMGAVVNFYNNVVARRHAKSEEGNDADDRGEFE